MTERPQGHRPPYHPARTSAGPAWSLPPDGRRAGPRPVVVHPVRGDDGRLVTLRGRRAGVARSLTDVVELLRLAGVALDADEVATSPLIEWRGGGPGAWWSP
ncbi:hypothetical protein ABZY90_32285 [Streptomyces sp. NPDC006422]|uniref:hypothetical protein n=1 Tax=unclassified Streptomyces TaxID=2593676 RepID=UPI0033BBC133